MTDKEVMQSAMNEHCPACGYYCLGNGGVYCIDKPTTVETTRACLAQPEQYDQTELALCKKCGWKAVWPDGCLVCEKQKVKPEPAECDGGQCGIGGYCKQCPKTQHEPEPVAWANLNALTEQINSVNCGTVYRLPSEAEGRQPLYTTPPQREWQTLTENEIKHLWYEACQTNLELTSQLIVHLARNIEAKLKEKNT